MTCQFTLYLPPADKRFILNFQPIPATIGQRIKYNRIKLGYRLKELSERIGLSISTVGAYENDQVNNPDPLIIQKIANLFDISESMLLDPNSPNKTAVDIICPPTSFGSKIKNFRLKRNIDQKELAKLIGVNRESIRRYEKDLSKPNKQIMSKIEETLKTKNVFFNFR